MYSCSLIVGRVELFGAAFCCFPGKVSHPTGVKLTEAEAAINRGLDSPAHLDYRVICPYKHSKASIPYPSRSRLAERKITGFTTYSRQRSELCVSGI